MKGNLNSDNQQFYKYQQFHQSPLTKKKHDVLNPGLYSERNKQVARLSLLMGSIPPFFS
jgi:hypothetical protein